MPWQVSTDQMGRRIELAAPPTRILSLVPSQTELLYDLGAGDAVAGVTRYCIHPPEWQKEKTVVGGTKRLDFPTIEKLRPDLIIGSKEENRKDDIDRLARQYPVWMSDVVTFPDALQMITQVSDLVSRREAGDHLVTSIQNEFASLPTVSMRVLYLIWYRPWMGVASGTFIDAMLSGIGAKNILKDQQRYPILSEEELKALRPELVLLSTEPFPFSARHREEIQRLLPDAKILSVDGEMFSWYGSRLLKAPAYFRKLAW